MQDAHTIIENMLIYFRVPPSTEVERLSYFAVFDGHGGARAAEFAAKHLHLHMVSRFPRGGVKQIDKDIRRVLYDAYKKTDENFLRESIQQRPHWRDGSTAATALLVNNTLYLANLGDSKIVLARVAPLQNEEKVKIHDRMMKGISGVPGALCLTRDHNPVDYEERQRIQATGATVQNGRVNNVLEVSRSFGDYQFKKQGVTCIPDVRKCHLTENDKFLLIACDGLWKSFPPSEAVTLVDRLLQQEISAALSERQESYQKPQSGSVNSANAVNLLIHKRVESVCTHIVNEAVLRMSGDNVTCILIVFSDAYEAPYPRYPTAVAEELTKTVSDRHDDTHDPVVSPTKQPRNE
ncbi:Integrin-linked kinase-associated serine/threonine phosphatase [Fasciolopsis buskii]|uniref:Integrin-linked kinase-associated serine/threonine phosphatase n=1 Tax=Fasciolopsis buskii TaxID=27845 RepID=A0A8E0RT39_9TREM|nr:Integrin-linked kinase-associated serine/threonine phosphatase [Fasciolopsis buski]